MKVTAVWSTAFVLLMVLATAAIATKKKSSTSTETASQFECGFNPMNPPHMPFSFQFFLVSLLFLIFDVEIALVLAYPLEPTTTKNWMMISLFLLILTIGLLYEWQKSKIDWSEWGSMSSLQELKSQQASPN